jgi:hypothetical protein
MEIYVRWVDFWDMHEARTLHILECRSQALEKLLREKRGRRSSRFVFKFAQQVLRERPFLRWNAQVARV